MSTEASYSLQQSLYSLYRKYYHSGCVVLLGKQDFANGTLRLTKPGLYVVREDIEFNPDESYLKSNPNFANNNAYSMGYFAAITVETDGVILDLQGHTIRQSYEHYARQRFFSVVELANAPFVLGQGPGTVRTESSLHFKPATNCLIVNGTLGLSSHSGIHGNNNTNIMVQNVCVKDFESAGIQLNGVDTAFLDSVVIKGIQCAPLSSHTFTLLRHQKELSRMESEDVGSPLVNVVVSGNGAGAVTCASLNRLSIMTAVDDLVALLIQPFVDADVTHSSSTCPLSVTEVLNNICTCLRELTDTDTSSCGVDVSTVSGGGGDVRLDIQRYVQQPDSSGISAPDGSAIYGCLFNSTGIAIGELSDVCVENGGLCCPVTSRNTHTTCCRLSKSVTVHNCTISDMVLNARESVAVKIDGTIQRDITGAIVDISKLDRTQGGSVLEYAQVYVNSENESQPTWCTGIQRAMVCSESEYSYEQLLADCEQIEFVYNVDIMAHVSKGIFGVRAEDTKGLSVENTCIQRLHNTSETTCPRAAYGLPADAKVVSIIANPTDQTEDIAHGGSNVRGLFIGKSEGVLLTKVTLETLLSAQGMSKGAEFDYTHTACIHALNASGIAGIISTSIQVNGTCNKLTMREVKNSDPQPNAPIFRTLLDTVKTACKEADADPTNTTKQDAKNKALCRLLRLPSTDTQLLAFETPASTGDVKLC